MIRKALISAAAFGVLGLLVFGRDATSYVRTSFGWVKSSVKNSVPIEFEIERARHMVKNLVPDIRKNMHVIAQEEVEIERLDKQINNTVSTQEKDRVEIMRLKEDLSQPKTHFQYAGRTFSVQQVKVELSNRFERYKTHEATLESLRDILAARRKSLDAARQKLDGMLANRRQLEVDVENLEARLKMVEVAQTTSEYNIDDSQLGRVKELIADVRTRLHVAERMATAECQLGGEISVGTAPVENIVDQVTEYFSGNQDTGVLAATPGVSR